MTQRASWLVRWSCSFFWPVLSSTGQLEDDDSWSEPVDSPRFDYGNDSLTSKGGGERERAVIEKEGEIAPPPSTCWAYPKYLYVQTGSKLCTFF